MPKPEKNGYRRDKRGITYQLGVLACWSLSLSSFWPLGLPFLSFPLATSSTSLSSLLPLLPWSSVSLSSSSSSSLVSSIGSSCRCRVDPGRSCGWGSAAAMDRKRSGGATEVPSSSSLRSDLFCFQINK